MSPSARFLVLPPNATQVSDSLAILHDKQRVVFFNAGGPIFSCDAGDRIGLRLAAVTVVKQGLGGTAAVADALGMHRTTIFRDKRKFEKEGVKGFAPKPRGPRGPHTLTRDVRLRAQELLDRGESIRSTATRIGMSDRGVRHAIRRGLLTRSCEKGAEAPVARIETEEICGPRARADQDQSCEAGVAVKRTMDRVLAATGFLIEADPQFQANESVRGAGVLLALPALLEQGLIRVGEKVHGGLRKGFFGLRSILLTFAIMALLRIKTPEQLTEHAPGELGLLLGLDRAPEVKTLRRKLREMGERRLARSFSQQLMEYWSDADTRELAILYVDGHVRPYHGRKHALPKQHVQQRGRPMPGTKDFHVNDRRVDPLLCVTAEANESLLAMLETAVLPKVRDLVGRRRRVTIVFDREGWSPRHFKKWKESGFDILTYRKGDPSRWQRRFFRHVTGRVGGKKVSYLLAERKVKLSNGLKVREVRRLTDDGHQTAVITTHNKMPMLAIAHRMFSRWRQENFFRYMRQDFALDHLCTNGVEPADPKRLVPCPERTALERKRRAARAARARLFERYAKLVPGKTIRVGKKSMNQEELDGLMKKQEAEIERLAEAIQILPKHVPVDQVMHPEKVVKLERERKMLVDAIKMTAYRAESSLARLVEPFFARHEEETRKFLKSIFQATADLIPDETQGTLTVRFHGLASPRATRALAQLCALVTEQDAVYPGTDLRLRYEAPTLQK